MHVCAVRGWLHEAVRTSCLHTNQRWCLLSALILVNTDVCVRKRSDRCMIEVLKCRHSQQLSSLWISQGSCVFCPDTARVTSLFIITLLCLLWMRTHLTQDLVLIVNSFEQIKTVVSPPSTSHCSENRRTNLVFFFPFVRQELTGAAWTFVTFSKTLLQKQIY